ncbi:MAG: sigma-54 dependent transcriptional regulator [Candidatus Riflebacteria bacterium]|nr:sigma-54 dependent transcriptional regulator [Candidatus Riflebacteria bacterium]
MSRSDHLKELAGDFLAQFSPPVLKQVDALFDQLKSDSVSKLAVNFGLAMPPEMRRRVLASIGLEDKSAPQIPDRHLPYLIVMKNLVEKFGDSITSIGKEEMAGQIWREGRRLRLFENEIQQLVDFFPAWLTGIARKKAVELSPARVGSVNSASQMENYEDSAGDISFGGIIGQSETMRSMFSCLKKISGSNLSILIQGESGTGKELVAHAIHSLSDRAGNSFIPVNCGALPDSIIESELFGYEKGAFTGAGSQKPGYFEIANHGTIFLDEITETSLNTQVKLLRVLQEQQFYRVGGTRPVSVDCRIIAATNRDMLEMAKTGAFRHDLYYRINEMTISLPPLRERKEDLPSLVKHFLQRFAAQNNRTSPAISAASWRILHEYNWPGNIRELENALKRAVVLADETIEPDHLPAGIKEAAMQNKFRASMPENGSFDELMACAEREILSAQLQKHNFNVSKTSAALQISRRTLQRKIKQLGLDKIRG